jgi:hypothetical protein
MVLTQTQTPEWMNRLEPSFRSPRRHSRGIAWTFLIVNSRLCEDPWWFFTHRLWTRHNIRWIPSAPPPFRSLEDLQRSIRKGDFHTVTRSMSPYLEVRHVWGMTRSFLAAQTMLGEWPGFQYWTVLPPARQHLDARNYQPGNGTLRYICKWVTHLVGTKKVLRRCGMDPIGKTNSDVVEDRGARIPQWVGIRWLTNGPTVRD